MFTNHNIKYIYNKKAENRSRQRVFQSLCKNY